MTEVRDTDKGWGRLVRMAQNAERVVRVGVQGSDGAAAHDEDGAEGLTNLALAIIHEFGVPEVGLDERSFMRATLDANADKYTALARKLGKSVLDGTRTLDQALALFGERVRADIAQWINDGKVEPDISDETKRRKGSDKPLLDTAQLRNAINSVVGDRRQ